MKRIAIFYRNRINYSAIQYIEDNLLSILDGYVEIRNLFLNELGEFEQIEADAFLVLYEEMLPLLVKHIRDFSKIIVITRSIKREHIQPLLALPSGTDVLVVNDSRESTLQTVFITYEVGIGHLNLIPFDADLYQRGAYDTIDHAIVARGSEELVPPHIHHVINIRNRDVSFGTFQNIIRQLHLENTPAQSNLLRKVQDDLDTGSTFIENYLGGYLKDQLLLSAVGNLQAGILLLDRTGHVHYVNERAHQILGLINGDTVTGTAGLDPIFTDRREYRDHLVHLEESNYLIQKTAIKIADTTIGYSFVLQSEKDLRDSEAGLNARLKSKGLYAKYTFDDIVSRSHAMNRSLEDARRIASSEYTVLIRGESGTGKELVA
ncbi:MAG: sigma 54-interacting transcriptional regulator, partial [Clostridia bacterium]|nr:sigma 54-interacting transcriptional regulator [Clostridia bacterium]